MSDIHVEALYSYPVKACAPIAADSFPISPGGIKWDRNWVITRENGLFLSQRTDPKLALIRTAITDEDLLLTLPDGTEIPVPLEQTDEDARERSLNIFNKVGTGVDEGEAAANALSSFVGQRVRLWRSKEPRHVNPTRQLSGYGSAIGFADGAPLLLTSLASLQELNKYASAPLNMLRFRPNIVVAGTDLEPYAEDYWRHLTIGRAKAIIGWACARCPVPNVDPTKGVLPKPAGRIATLALRASRLGIEPTTGQEEVFFGQNVLIHQMHPDVGISIHIGDPVVAHGLSSARNFELLSEASERE